MLGAGAPTLESTATLEMDQGTSGLTMTTLFSRSSASALPVPSVRRHSWSVSMMASVWLQATMHETTLVASTPVNGVERDVCLYFTGTDIGDLPTAFWPLTSFLVGDLLPQLIQLGESA